MLAVQDEQGIFFTPATEVVALVRDHPQRWRVVLSDGRVANLPGEKPVGPWVPLGDAWLLPQKLRRSADGYHDLAGFFYAGAELAPVSISIPSSPEVPGLPCRLDQVLSVKTARGQASWSTDLGVYTQPLATTGDPAGYRGLVPIHRGLFANSSRLGRVLIEMANRGDQTISFWSDRSQFMVRFRRDIEGAVAARFGLSNLTYLLPDLSGLRSEQLRDWPFELARAQGHQLKQSFDHPTRLIANILWQALRFRQLGIPLDYDYEYRGFYYTAIQHACFRAGFLNRGATRRSKRTWDDGELWLMFQTVAAEMVGTHRLFTFRELGFSDPNPEFRSIGSVRPHIIVVAEKSSERPQLESLQKKFGVTTVITGGKPRWLAVDYLVAELQKVVSGPVMVIAYVDYDPSGWQIARTFVTMLLRYGLTLAKELVILPRLEHFTAEEIDFALPCPADDATENEKWIAEGGGVYGQALGLHTNDLRPGHRIVDIIGNLIS